MGVDLNMEHNVNFQKVIKLSYYTISSMVNFNFSFNRDSLRERVYTGQVSILNDFHPLLQCIGLLGINLAKSDTYLGKGSRIRFPQGEAPLRRYVAK